MARVARKSAQAKSVSAKPILIRTKKKAPRSIVRQLSNIEQQAFGVVNLILGNYVKPSHKLSAEARSNSKADYFTIRLDDEIEICYITLKNGNVASIVSDYFNIPIASPNEIYFHASKLIEAFLFKAAKLYLSK